MKTNQMKTGKDYSQFAAAGESATITCILQILKGRQKRGKAL